LASPMAAAASPAVAEPLRFAPKPSAAIAARSANTAASAHILLSRNQTATPPNPLKLGEDYHANMVNRKLSTILAFLPALRLRRSKPGANSNPISGHAGASCRDRCERRAASRG